MSSHRTEQLAPTDFSPPSETQSQNIPVRLIAIAAPVLLLVICLLYFVIAASSLQVSTVPVANISIQGGWHVAIGQRYLVLPGEFTVLAETPGYRQERVEVTVESGRSAAIEMILAPLPGNLHILTEPEVPVQVSLNQEDQGLLTNPLLSNLEAGTYQLSLDAWLYEAWSQEIVVPGKGETLELEVRLEPNWVNYRVESDPSGADIYLEGQSVGVTPMELPIEIGEREMSLSYLGYRDYQAPLWVEETDDLVVREFAMIPLESSLAINSDPTAATVTLNGEYLGETPLSVELAPEQLHQLALFKAGYLGHSDQIRMQHLENRAIEISLKPDLADISIAVSPEDAEVLVDGVVVGSGSQNLELMTRKQSISVRRDGYETQVQEILPTRNLALHLSFRLLTEEESEWADIPSRYATSQNQEMLLFRDAGSVQLGSDRPETERRANETRWSANLERAFYVAATQVTNSQYRAYNADHSSGNRDGESLDGPNQPVVNVSWQEAALYANWLSEREGLTPYYTTARGFVSGVNPDSIGFRLMTEAEWSWLARTTTTGLTQKYSWGDSDDPSTVENIAGVEASGLINFYIESVQDRYSVSAPVGSFPPNHRGLSDINGNASEWIHDWYEPRPYPEGEVQTDPLGPEIGEFHVIRGANWARGYLPQLRLAYRDFGATARDDVGFRVARYAN
ncbi:MAG: PEGA domain-containing protein [Porticoccaceae bacterium]|nr:PEGA domain-containing protein [Porticoccaceae bacterium]